MYGDPLTILADYKRWAKITGTNDDALISRAINVASELIARECSRPNLGNVYAYAENYYPGQRATSWRSPTWKIVMRHYPVVQLSSVLINNAAVNILGNTDLQVGNAGVVVEEDDEPRTLRFMGITAYMSSPVLVSYTAGYAPADIPPGLSHACNVLIAELLRKQSFVNLRSVAQAGETTSVDMGSSWGMSAHVKNLLQIYCNKVPFYER